MSKESVKDDDKIESLVRVNRPRAGSQFRNRRTSMGEYIPPPRSKPLTSLGDCNPAPSDYSPKVDLTQPSTAQYSIAGPYKEKKCQFNVGPADYNTLRDLGRGRRMTLKEKGKMRTFDISGDKMSDSVGAAGYLITYNNTGRSGSKFSMSYRHSEGINTGPPNKLVQPVDTRGLLTPGPNYRPQSGHREGPHKSIGLKIGRDRHITVGPGPAEYNVHVETGGAAYSLAKRLTPQQASDNPAPNAYDTGTTIGKAVAKSISGRHEGVQKKDFVPAPNMYTLPDRIMNATTGTLGFRWPEDTLKPAPSPAHYTITNVCLKKAPAFTMRRKTVGMPCFPDINQCDKGENDTTPGPAHYTVTKRFSENDKPSYSIGKRARSAKKPIPGPNQYRIKVKHRPDAPKAPAHSMAKRFESPLKNVAGPGPAAYFPDLPKNYDLSCSMTKRPKSRKGFVTPAANAYRLETGQTAKGKNNGPRATLKSRASPFVYSGIASTHVRLE